MDTKLSEMKINKLDEALHGLCLKARSENLPQPYRLAIIDPKDRTAKLWEEVVHYDEDTSVFDWDKSYPEFTGEILALELTAFNDLILVDHVTFEEPAKQMEAAAD